jgi:hypothetical protein
MAELKNKIEDALNEVRILLLGGQVLLGFAYRTYFEPGFERLPQGAQVVQTLSLSILSSTLGLLVWPVPVHQITDGGKETAHVHRFITRLMDWILLPFAIGTGLSVYPVAVAMGIHQAGFLSCTVAVLALFAWYGMSLPKMRPGQRARRLSESAGQEAEDQRDQKRKLSEQIKDVLIECRMALPGAQAMLGFQFIIIFTDSFEKLPRSLQWIHFASLLATLITTILLIAPAAYHRIAESGEETEHFRVIASRLLLLALVFLAPGMAGDVAVVIGKLSGSVALGIKLAAAQLILLYLLWFGYSVWSRKSRREASS